MCAKKKVIIYYQELIFYIDTLIYVLGKPMFFFEFTLVSHKKELTFNVSISSLPQTHVRSALFLHVVDVSVLVTVACDYHIARHL